MKTEPETNDSKK